MSIAVLPRDIVGGGGGGGGKAVVERRIGCNAAAAVAPRSVQAPDDHRGEISTFSSSSSSSLSSIGKDSDGSFGEGLLGALCHQEDSGEVQSDYKGPLSAFDALEESLPIRHGISRYYSGKSKSFSNLRSSLTASSSCTDLAKADNPYAKKRKNALAFSLMYQRTYRKPTICEQSVLRSIITESNGDVSESKRQRPLNEPTMTKKNGLI